MSSQPPNDKQDTDSVKPTPQTAAKLIEDAILTINSVINSVNYQVLGNADGLHENIKDSDERATLKILVENMVKKPFRRQVGRLKQVKRLLIEAKSKLE